MKPANKKYILTPERRAYLEQHYHRISNNEILQHFLFRDVSRGCLHRWAGDLGLTRSLIKHPWTSEEEAYLASYSHLSLSTLSRRMNRSRFDIARKMRMVNIDKMSNGLTVTDVASGLGCDKSKVVAWINRGWLKAQRREYNRVDAPWMITGQAVKQFIRNHPNEVNKYKIDWLWFLDIVFDGLGELIDMRSEA